MIPTFRPISISVHSSLLARPANDLGTLLEQHTMLSRTGMSGAKAMRSVNMVSLDAYGMPGFSSFEYFSIHKKLCRCAVNDYL
jgi:hypothetical protein